MDVAIAADVNVAIQADKNVTQNEAEKKLKCKNNEQLGVFC